MMTIRKGTFSAIAAAAMLLCAAQAQANPFVFTQTFNDAAAGVIGTVSGTFSGVDANADNLLEASEITFLTLGFVGTVPTLGAINLSFTPPDILANPAGTAWVTNDPSLGAFPTGFFVSGTSATSTQMTWVAGPLNGFDFGNFGGPNGDPQNSTFDFGQVSFFTGINSGELPIGTAAFSQTYANVTAVPEPATYLMMLGGVAALLAGTRRRAA